jgi:hypothetical protein
VYSFGMTMLEVRVSSFCRKGPSSILIFFRHIQIYTGRAPFSHRRNDTSVVCDIHYGRRPHRPDEPDLTDSIWELIQSCWHQDPDKRANINVVGIWLALISQTQKFQVDKDRVA